MDQIICSWTTYKGSHCKRIVITDDSAKQTRFKFCNLHRELIAEYSRVKEDDLCEIFKEIRVTPRSHRHIKTIMTTMGNEDDIVQVYLSGGSIEDADITNADFIVLDSDNSKFYYSPKKGQNKAKNLKVILKEYCQNNAIVNYGGVKYCEDCYKKGLKDVPRISLIM